jgi:hypothetical protein
VKDDLPLSVLLDEAGDAANSILAGRAQRSNKSITTRLKRMDDKTQDCLINWGYAVSDAALRAHVNPALPDGQFPYPQSGVSL